MESVPPSTMIRLDIDDLLGHGPTVIATSCRRSPSSGLGCVAQQALEQD